MKVQYKSLLFKYVADGGEPELELAYELGRKAIDDGVSVLEVVDVHYEALTELLMKVGTAEDSVSIAKRGNEFLKETLAPYEMTRLGFRDTIALLRSQNERLTKLMEEKSQLLKQREDFMMVVTHDLKTPITAAERCLKLLLEGDYGELNPSTIQVLSVMKDSNQRMFTMVKNLLEAYRYEQSAPILNRRKLQLKRVLDSVVDEFSSSANMRGVNLIVKEGDDPTVYADELAIHHVLSNLIDNALKFTPRDGSITLSAEHQGDYGLVKVGDTGHGIAEEDLPRLFQRFFQSDTGRKQYTGTGLGLHLCREIVKAHEGEIKCDSKVGVGTTFSFTLPIYTAEGESLVDENKSVSGS